MDQNDPIQRYSRARSEVEVAATHGVSDEVLAVLVRKAKELKQRAPSPG